MLVVSLRSESDPSKRKALKIFEFPKMEKALFNCFTDQGANNLPVSNEMLKEQVKLLHVKIQKKTGGFLANNGWVVNFKKRHEKRELKVYGEKLANKSDSINPFLGKFNKTIRVLSLTKEQIYNANESGLF